MNALRRWPSPDVPPIGQVARDETRPRLTGSVTGLVRNVTVATIQGGNNTSQTVVTFRLEQYQARAGRTAVITVRLFGDAGVGFASDGDTVEVSGRRKRGFLDAKQAYNHTTGSEFRSPSGCGKAVLIVAFVLVVAFIIACWVGVAIGFFTQ